jgi:membrane associated rhomboid family serine protease
MKQRGFLSTYTGVLIFINVVAFILALFLMNFFGEGVFLNLALIPSEIIAGRKLWTLFTSMFLHSPSFLVHIFFNMITLMFIGTFVEKLIGKKRFLYLYFVGGFIASLFYVFSSLLIGYDLPGVGASGAIFALGGLLAVLTPRLPVLVMFVIPMPMWMAMMFLMFGMWGLSLSIGLPVANSAHLGGLIVGVGYGFYLKKKFPRKTQMISKYFSR